MDGSDQELFLHCTAQPARKEIRVSRKKQNHQPWRKQTALLHLKKHSIVFWISSPCIDSWCLKQKVFLWLQGFFNQVKFYSPGYSVEHTWNISTGQFCGLCALWEGIQICCLYKIAIGDNFLRKYLEKNLFPQKWHLRTIELFSQIVNKIMIW